MAKCWKIADGTDTTDREYIRIGEDSYALGESSEKEAEMGAGCLEKWYVERKYKTQVCGPDHPRPYYDMKSEMQELCFEELIFNRGECIGAYHDGIIILFGNERTHYQEKYLGEMPTGPDQAITFYDYYYLRSK